MSDINVFTCTGRLGAEPETRYTQGGTAVWNIRIAVGYGYGDHAGTNWLNVAVFGKRAEALDRLDIAKGERIAVTGELRLRKYTRNDGGDGWSHEINARDVVLLGKPTGGNGGAAQASAPPAQEKPAQPAQSTQADIDDDIPF